MSSTAPLAAQVRFQRYVAVLLATTLPLVAVVEFSRAIDGTPMPWARLAGPMALTAWAVVVARSEEPNSIPLILSAMWFIATLVFVEALFGVDVTSFDFSTTFGLVMLFAVLVGTLSMGSRFLWAGGLAVAVATWVLVVGILTGDSVDAMGVRTIVAVAGVVFTTALVAELYDQLTAAIEAHDRARRLQDAVARCSEALLVHPDSFALHEAVRAVFEATNADYAYIDRTIEFDGEPGWEIVASAEHGVREVGVDWQTGKYSMIPTTYASLVSGEAAIVRTSELSGTERELYESDKIFSEIGVPVLVGGEFRGTVGFIDYSDERLWTDDEVETLWRAADMVGSYWKRQDDAAALRQSNESKDKLLASVSHEIRTPLTAIVGLSEEIARNRKSMTDEELDELNRIIAVQSRELAELVEDLLVASRADFGNLSIRSEPIELRDQVDQVLEGLRESTPTNKTVTSSCGPITAWADPLRVRQIMRNLVTNAIKYGGDLIVVGLHNHDDHVRVVVSDNGAGIDEHEATLIFERYYRSAQSPTQPGSVGIGLAVSRQLAEMMGGTLTYVPGGPQHRFELTLPLAEETTKGRVPEHA